MKKILSIIIIALCCVNIMSAKQKLRVLYVGGSPNFDTNDEKTPEDIARSAKERTADFASFLSKYFTTVKAIQGKDYVASMSDNYDVTIFDGKPKAIREKKIIYDDNGEFLDMIEPVYVPFDFNRACICIADMSEAIGRSLGTKNDWFCLCLDAEAHHWKADHPIFRGPFKLRLNAVKKPTPASAFEYGPIYGYTVEDSCMMFPVQKSGYSTVRGARVGMVSRPWGYEDSPEAESISSGVCAKSIDAVALGRHANFFHWGFAAAPKDMTEEGKVLFANVVAYMAKFNGQHPIARKMDERMEDRLSWQCTVNQLKEENYEEYVKAITSFNAINKKISDSLKAVVAAGGKISQIESAYYLNYSPQEINSRDEYTRQLAGELYEYMGSDEKLYKEYYAYNAPYMYYDYKERKPKIDIDARELGIPNNDIRILDKCISMLENPETSGEEDIAKANRILNRYTLARFGSAKEWRNWFDTYKDKMFFTEGGGFLWLINTFDTSVPGNDYSVRTLEEEVAEKAPQASETNDKNPIAVSASLVNTSDGQKEILVRMKIHPGYHTYLGVVEKDPFIPTEIKMELSKGYTKDGILILPSFSTIQSGTTIFEGDCIFRQKINGSGTGKATVEVSYQCCNKDICFPPTTKKIEIEL